MYSSPPEDDVSKYEEASNDLLPTKKKRNRVRGQANNLLIENVSRALVSKTVIKFEGTILKQTDYYSTYKIFSDLFLPGEKRDSMVPEGIQSKDLCKIRSGSRDKKTSGVAAENKLNDIYGTKYRINLDHQILTDHGIFYSHALFSDLLFEVTLASAAEVVKGSDPTKLNYKLTNIQLEYKMIRSEKLANQAISVYDSGKEFLYDHVKQILVKPIKSSEMRINIHVNNQSRSLKGILLLFQEPYTAGTRDSEMSSLTLKKSE